jgi:hypothetical protein
MPKTKLNCPNRVFRDFDPDCPADHPAPCGQISLNVWSGIDIYKSRKSPFFHKDRIFFQSIDDSDCRGRRTTNG